MSDPYYGTEESGDYYGTTGLYGRGVEDKPDGKGITRRAREAAGSVAERAKEAGSRVSETAGSITSSVANAASSATSSVTGAASSAAGAASAALEASASGARRAAELITHSSSALRHNTVAAGRDVASFLQEQPLVLAGAGLAIGAALGALFPATRTENELMGETSDAIKKATEEQLEKGKEFAGRVWEEAKQEAGKLGLASVSGVPQADIRGAGENMYPRASDDDFSEEHREGMDQPQHRAPEDSFDTSTEPPRRDGF
jgi:hypothetical protein